MEGVKGCIEFPVNDEINMHIRGSDRTYLAVPEVFFDMLSHRKFFYLFTEIRYDVADAGIAGGRM